MASAKGGWSRIGHQALLPPALPTRFCAAEALFPNRLLAHACSVYTLSVPMMPRRSKPLLHCLPPGRTQTLALVSKPAATHPTPAAPFPDTRRARYDRRLPSVAAPSSGKGPGKPLEAS